MPEERLVEQVKPGLDEPRVGHHHITVGATLGNLFVPRFADRALMPTAGGILLFASRGWNTVSRDRVALFWALATSLCIAAYTIADGLGGRLSGNVPGYMFALGVLDSIFIIVYTAWVRGVPAVVGTLQQWKLNFFSGGLALAAYTLVVWVMTQAPIPLVSALRETSIVIAALIGAFYFKEASGKRRIIASLIIFVSVVLLGFDR